MGKPSSKELDEMLRKFQDKDCPDTMTFSIKKTKHEKGMLFSVEALETFLQTIRLYIGGRIIGRHEVTKEEPETVKVTVTIEHLNTRIRDGQHKL